MTIKNIKHKLVNRKNTTRTMKHCWSFSSWGYHHV